MDSRFNQIIKCITNPEFLKKFNSSINISDELYINDQSDLFIARKINAAFLVLLTGEDTEYNKKAQDIFNHYKNQDEWKPVIYFYETGLKQIRQEISILLSANLKFSSKLKADDSPFSTVFDKDWYSKKCN